MFVSTSVLPLLHLQPGYQLRTDTERVTNHTGPSLPLALTRAACESIHLLSCPKLSS